MNRINKLTGKEDVLITKSPKDNVPNKITLATLLEYLNANSLNNFLDTNLVFGQVYERNAITTETSGTLIVGETYTIDNIEIGDDFTNVADVQSGVINQDGCVFIATGTTPTDWSNGSTVTNAGSMLLVEGEVSDMLGYNKLVCTLSADTLTTLGSVGYTVMDAPPASIWYEIPKVIYKYTGTGLALTTGYYRLSGTADSILQPYTFTGVTNVLVVDNNPSLGIPINIGIGGDVHANLKINRFALTFSNSDGDAEDPVGDGTLVITLYFKTIAF